MINIKKRTMLQCMVCTTVYTKDGKPNKFFNYNDRHIYGCSECKKGEWKHQIRNVLPGWKKSVVKYKDEFNNICSINDTGYLDHDRDKSEQIEDIPLEQLI